MKTWAGVQVRIMAYQKEPGWFSDLFGDGQDQLYMQVLAKRQSPQIKEIDGPLYWQYTLHIDAQKCLRKSRNNLVVNLKM